jgi:hypothetical protein
MEMKMLKYCAIGLGLLALLGCKNVRTQDSDGLRIESSGLNTTVIYRHSGVSNSDSLKVVRHFFGNSYYLEDYGCDGIVDRIYLFGVGKSLYKVDPITGKETKGYDKELFRRADALLKQHKIELGIDTNDEDSGSLVNYLD